MRRRSYTIEADSVEDLTEKAIRILKSPPIQLPQQSASLVHLKSYKANSPTRIGSTEPTKKLQLRARSYSAKETTEDFWADFDFREGDKKDPSIDVKEFDDQ